MALYEYVLIGVAWFATFYLIMMLVVLHGHLSNAGERSVKLTKTWWAVVTFLLAIQIFSIINFSERLFR